MKKDEKRVQDEELNEEELSEKEDNDISPELEEEITEGDLEEEEPEGENPESEKDESEELRDKYLRLVAEFDNYRRRTAKERIALMQTAEKDVIKTLLDVLDDADRAEIEMQKTDDVHSVREGATLIFDKLRKTLKSRGVTEMECIHEPYDAELQEAIAEIPAPSEDLKGKVIDNVQKGYYLNDKLIRHAKVVVGK